MKQMAEAAASVLDLEAHTIEQPIDAPVDVLLLGTAV